MTQTNSPDGRTEDDAPEWIFATGDGVNGSWTTREMPEVWGAAVTKYRRADLTQPDPGRTMTQTNSPSGRTAKLKDDARGPDWEGFCRDLLDEWPVRDVEGSELFDAALRNGLIVEIPGGYDPDQHIDAEGICPEAGDPWYEYAFHPARADLAPQRICDWCDETSPQRKARCPVKGCGTRADLEATASLSIATQPDPLADPRVTALVEALQVYADGCDATETTPCGYDGNMCCMTARTALAAFNTTDKPQGANNEVKGGKDE